MRSEIDLKEIERRAWGAYFQDGIWELFFGVFLIGIALSPLLSVIGVPRPLNIFLPLLAALILWGGKRFVTRPRLGLVKFGPKRKADAKKLRIVMTIITLITVVILLLTVTEVIQPVLNNLLGGYAFPIVLGLFVLTVFSLAAYFREFTRLYIYGVLMCIGVVLTGLLFDYGGSTPYSYIAFGIIGSIILLFGLILLVRFVRKYPLPVGDVSNEE